MKPQLVFVYGTLKSGYGNNHILKTSRLLGAAETIGKLRMFDAGFPVVRPRTEKPGDWNATVMGEVYLVTASGCDAEAGSTGKRRPHVSSSIGKKCA